MSVLTREVGVPAQTEAPVDEFSALVAEYRLRAYHFALQLVGNPDDALDLTQDAFLKVHSNWHRRDASRPFAPWFYTILRNLAIDLLRKRTSRKEDVTDSPPDLSPRPGPEVLAQKSQLQEQVWKAINQLSDPLREVVILKDLHGFSYREIAEITKTNTTTVNSRLHDAREILRRKLRRLL